MTETVLITGASRGIGRAVALLCGARGWSVGVNYTRNEAAARDVVAAVEQAGGAAIAVQGNVADEAEVVAMFDAVEAAFGPVTKLVNNAGVIGERSKLVDMDTARIRRILDVNLFGAILCAREAARRMGKAGRGGVIVNLSSAAARLGSANEFVDYAATKGAIDSLTIGLAKELGPNGIRVNAVRPGLIETEIHADAGFPERAAVFGKDAPLGRSGTAEETAEAVLWLLGDAASYVSGALVDVTGGR